MGLGVGLRDFYRDVRNKLLFDFEAVPGDGCVVFCHVDLGPVFLITHDEVPDRLSLPELMPFARLTELSPHPVSLTPARK